MLYKQVWQRLDDVIMGGQSSSGLQAAEGGGSAVWTGDLIFEGGGFCGTRTASRDWGLGGSAGIQLRVRGDGQTFKLNLKTVRATACHGTCLPVGARVMKLHRFRMCRRWCRSCSLG